ARPTRCRLARLLTPGLLEIRSTFGSTFNWNTVDFRLPASAREAMRLLAAGPLLGTAVVLSIHAGTLPARGQPGPSADPPPAQVRQVIQLLHDPVVRAWMDEQREPSTVPATATVPVTTSGMMTQSITSLQEHLALLAAAVPRLPDELQQARRRLL